MSEDSREIESFETDMAAHLLAEMSAFAATVGECCLHELPRHLKFRDTQTNEPFLPAMT